VHRDNAAGTFSHDERKALTAKIAKDSREEKRQQQRLVRLA